MRRLRKVCAGPDAGCRNGGLFGLEPRATDDRADRRGHVCGTHNAAALDHRPIPEALGGMGLLESISKNGFKTNATMLGAPDPLDPVWYTEVKITPEQAKEICEKKLTAVYLDWSGVPYNLAMRSGAKAVFSALGIKILRFADYSFNPNGMAGVLAAIVPLRPDILVTGGTVNAAQFAAIVKPALDQGITLVAWSLGSPTMKIGQNEPQKAMITYDFYNLGLQMAGCNPWDLAEWRELRLHPLDQRRRRDPRARERPARRTKEVPKYQDHH